MENTKVDLLIEEILKILGDKIVTLTSSNEEFVIDIDKNKKFGYQEGLKYIFAAKLVRAMQEGGGMIIREFLPLKIKQKMANGKSMYIPIKAIYGVLLGEENWAGLDAAAVENAYNIDHETKEALPVEKDLCFRDFPII